MEPGDCAPSHPLRDGEALATARPPTTRRGALACVPDLHPRDLPTDSQDQEARQLLLTENAHP